MERLEKKLTHRLLFINERKEKFPDYHIFFKIINADFLQNNINDKILMMMMYTRTREALSYAVDGKKKMVDLAVNEYDTICSKLQSSESKRVMQSIKLPLDAFVYYKNKEFDKASNNLVSSLLIYNELFDKGCNDAVWANLEQNLNRVKIEIENGDFDEAFLKVKLILDEFSRVNDNGFCKMSNSMKTYLHMLSLEDLYVNLNYFIDSIFMKINKFSDEKYIVEFVNLVIDNKLYHHLKTFFIDNDIDKFYFNIEFPKTFEAYYFGKNNYEIKYPIVKKYLKDAYKINIS